MTTLTTLVPSLPYAATPPTSPSYTKDDYYTSLREIVVQFLVQLDYPTQLQSLPHSVELEDALRQEFSRYEPLRPRIESIVATACAMCEMPYFDHSPTIKLVIARFTCFAIYVEDIAVRTKPHALGVFQQRFVAREPQDDEILDGLATYLRDLWQYYEPFAANAIVSNALEFVSGCYLEHLTEGMRVSPRARRYPDYLRIKNGLADVFVYMQWPASQFPDVTSYIQAAPSIAHFSNITNDILSFYKEELANETANYVHLLKAVRGKDDALSVIKELVEEAVTLSNDVDATLSGDAKITWSKWRLGYLTFHLTIARYKLSDLAL